MKSALPTFFWRTYPCLGLSEDDEAEVEVAAAADEVGAGVEVVGAGVEDDGTASSVVGTASSDSEPDVDDDDELKKCEINVVNDTAIA